MEEGELLTLNQLFDSLGIIEKGIEKIYHYLLLNKRIDNLKEVSNQFDLTLKRGYKICSVLSDLELVQIYDRPMKIILVGDIIPIWQKLINRHIENLTKVLQETKDKVQTAFDGFIRKYKLSEVIIQEPVEFINYSLFNFDESHHQFLAQSKCKIAIGIRYANPLVSMVLDYGINNLPEDLRDPWRRGMIRISENLKNIDIQVIFNSELIDDLLNSTEFNILSEHLQTYNLKFKNIEVHITDENFSNFSVTDYELIQPSFDPTNKLIGAYISRNKSIYQIFYDKFNEIFEKGLPINQYITQEMDVTIDPLTETQSFVLCLI